ncbi:Hypothetical_protein [Hexamita inflata]|uniref:Hypothetical_protein n=1 Tax=Hexamita inflata TaxID=28002 RepID=A0AA86TPE9_9EUKA|nr:Hypothetical protein HINF_LOCUS11431 [Hexamita inflata]
MFRKTANGIYFYSIFIFNQEADSLNVRKNSIMLGSLWQMVWQMMSDASFFLLIQRIPNLRFFHTLYTYISFGWSGSISKISYLQKCFQFGKRKLIVQAVNVI